MKIDTTWLRYFVLLAFYLFFEGAYRIISGRFWITYMLEELLTTIRKLKIEMESDYQGARLCAWVMAIILIVGPVLIIVFSIASMVKHDSLKDIIVGLILLIFMILVALLMRLFNELCMSWIKKIQREQ